MLTPDQVTALRDAAAQITGPVSEYLLQDITRRIAEAGQLTSTAAYQAWRLKNLGVSQRRLKKELRSRLELSRQEVRRLIRQCAQMGYKLDVSRFPFIQTLSFARNKELQQIVAAAVELAQEDLSNMVQTIGFVTPYGKTEPLTRAYITSCDFVFQQVVTGAASYTQAIREATRNLANQGIRTINYESGISTSLEAAVRRNILGGLGLMQEQISQVTHDQMGCDGWEISAHANSAPDHEPFQGKQYSDAEYERLNSSLRRRISTLNCGHNAFPVILGVHQPQYSRAELEKFRTDNEKGVTVDGVHYTGYQATQMQRKLERAIRRQKNRILVDEAAGDAEKLSQDKTRLSVLHQRYQEFSKKAGLRTQYERTEVAKFGEIQNVELAKINFANGISEADRLSVEQEIAKIPRRAREIAEPYISEIILINDSTHAGSYNPKTGRLCLSKGRGPEAVAHEYGHAIEKALNIYADEEFLKIREKGFENLSRADIIVDDENFSDEILRVWHEKLVSLYQGRIYPNHASWIYAGGQITLDGMHEYFSEGFAFFVHAPEELRRRDPELFEYIRRLLE